jgi:hypothetical protein
LAVGSILYVNDIDVVMRVSNFFILASEAGAPKSAILRDYELADSARGSHFVKKAIRSV